VSPPPATRHRESTTGAADALRALLDTRYRQLRRGRAFTPPVPLDVAEALYRRFHGDLRSFLQLLSRAAESAATLNRRPWIAARPPEAGAGKPSCRESFPAYGIVPPTRARSPEAGAAVAIALVAPGFAPYNA
jgi:hypothetical protein